ncbi:hypothetical protein GCM10008995_26310 [Halobellus salinus]|uniref:site-specific DNA-methyltransferase (adenine-specific) n=1 Tax=Halobellus salinus TaxID=931585 RepID=A0A830EVR2_9EURY|nr:N-6 DNA methylase [Halobellus salinus]GGJ15244.1 hypothetical protein GCM10008995_26310 [Halobellus salinus]SMP25293.1 N-6 DNA Methylase [Halobellus salinus]
MDFRDELLKIASERTSVSYSGASEINTDEKVQEFVEIFFKDNLNQLLTQDAPKQIRRRKQAGIEEFYDLYVQLLFGEGSKSYDYDTTLIDTIRSPSSASDADVRKFAIKLVNRLLFVKFLEDNEVLPEKFLTERVEKYREASEVDQLTGGLYKTQLQPIFFSLFNTEKNDRISKHKGGWFDSVEYLNGSLFAPSEDERKYDVDDDMLINVVRDLIEGHKLEEDNGSLDPSVLGQVFEMTINHINSGQSQKDEGAYYTPNDVIQLINKKTIDPKVHEILVDTYSKQIVKKSGMEPENAREFVSSNGLGEMLGQIEQGEGYFGDTDALKEAYERLGRLRVIDPACGSGHFLTGVMDEIHRVRMSLLRGWKGDSLEDADIYDAKKELVLNSIYGVDINPIAVEIAKLRVWLKMVEEGWEPDYGELPNIDINIVAGNSLVGIPAISVGQSQLQDFDLDISELRQVREEYKEGEITRRELDNKIESLRPELDESFLSQINHYFEETISKENEWLKLTDGLTNLYPSIKKVTIRRVDEEQLTDKQKTNIENEGFYVEPRYEKSAKVEEGDIDNIDDFSQFLNNGLKLELERQPLQTDLRLLQNLRSHINSPDLAYGPFHWPVEFPEAATEDQNGDYDVEFDLVVGNPPYGDVQTEVEKQFTKGYKTGNVNDVIAPFIERQVNILKDGGYFGNIAALLFAYQGTASNIREVIRDGLANPEVACFSRRPQQVFAGSQARTGIITAKKEDVDDSSIYTSKFLRFSENNRRKVFNSIEYESTDGLTLGNRIGGGKDKSLPKIGSSTLRSILEKLKQNSDNTIDDVSTRSTETSYAVWRSRHPAYFINPCLDNLYPAGEKPQDFDPFYFSSEIEQKAAFVVLHSNLFYTYWMVYENERDLNWKSIDPFPLPKKDRLEAKEDEIEEVANELWDEIQTRFVGDDKEVIEQAGALKPIADATDELFGPMFDLTDEEIEYVQEYDKEYRLNDVDQTQLVSKSFSWQN